LKIPGTHNFDLLSTERDEWDDEWDLNQEVAEVMLEDVIFLQILTLRDPEPYWYGSTQVLMLRANEDGATFRRVGVVDFPASVDLLEERGWESRIFTIV
jgi:hypothetical protein